MAHLETKIKFTGKKCTTGFDPEMLLFCSMEVATQVCCALSGVSGLLRFCFCGFGVCFFFFWCGFCLDVLLFHWLFFLTPQSLFYHPRYNLPSSRVLPITYDCTNTVSLVSTETWFTQKTLVGLSSFEITRLCFNLFFLIEKWKFFLQKHFLWEKKKCLKDFISLVCKWI